MSERLMLEPVEKVQPKEDLLHDAIRAVGRIGLSVALGMGGGAGVALASEVMPVGHSAASADTGGYPWSDAAHISQPPAGDNITWGYSDKPTCDNRSAQYDCNTAKVGNWYFRDQWGYDLRNCTSYVAWRVAKEFGANVSGWGNAGNWDNAAAGKYSVDNTPEPGDIAVWDSGHVAYVESVTPDNKARVSEYNQGYDGNFRNDRVVTANHYIDINGPGNSANTSTGVGSDSIYIVKTKNTGGHVEIHSADANINYQNGQHLATWFSSADRDNGWFQQYNGDLYFIKTKNTGSGRVEIHSARKAQGYQDGIHIASPFSTGDADNGWFQMADVNHDGNPDLTFIKTKNVGSGHVELFVTDAAKSYQQVISANATWFSPVDASNGWFQVQGSDLLFIKTRNTGSGKVEYFRVPASYGYQRPSQTIATTFSPADQNNGWFSSEDINGDGNADLVFIKTHNTGSGRIEMFAADGASSYQGLIRANPTWLSTGDADNGWFQSNNKA